MYTYITGKLKEKNKDNIIIENSGLGYRLKIGTQTYSDLPPENKNIKLYTHHYIREDAEILFGFSTTGEKKLFKILLKVSNIGPGKAMGILSQISPDHFISAIRSEDIPSLSSIKGIGKKTAERLIVELRDKISDISSFSEKSASQYDSSKFKEAFDGLVGLGFKSREARKFINSVKKDIDKEATTQEIIKRALTNGKQ
ncbi:MAG: Holliday junction branch migration protein RuvA [Elusimicrobiota bacterium]